MVRPEIKEAESHTTRVQPNVYHMNLNVYILDTVRRLQDHPKYAKGLRESHIVDMLKKEPFCKGDVESQVRNTLKNLTSNGLLRLINEGYRTLGPFAKIALSRTPRQLNQVWARLGDLEKPNSSVASVDNINTNNENREKSDALDNARPIQEG